MNISWLNNTFLTRGFWGDEAWTIGISKLPITEIIRITGEDFHPPFYYFLVHYLGLNLGWGELTIRILSTFFFLLATITTYHLVRRFWTKNRFSAILTSLLVFFSPILITYAFEARSYGLLAFESVLSAYVFWQAKSEKKKQYKWRILYFLLGAIMVYTHYYAWFILAAHATYLLISERNRILPMLTPAFAILAAQLPWLPTLFGQVGQVKGDYWIGAINSRTHMEFFLRVTGGDLTTPWQSPLAITFGIIILIDFIYRIFTKTTSKQYIFLLSWLLTPVILPTIISLTFMPVFFYRYLIFSAIPISILTIRALSRLPKALILITMLALIYMQVRVDLKILAQHPRSMRETTTELNQLKSPTLNDDPVYTVLPSFAEVMHYTAPYHEIIITPEGLVQFSGKSLLDAYVRLGYTKIEKPPTSTPYYFLTPEKEIKYITPSSP